MSTDGGDPHESYLLFIVPYEGGSTPEHIANFVERQESSFRREISSLTSRNGRRTHVRKSFIRQGEGSSIGWDSDDYLLFGHTFADPFSGTKVLRFREQTVR